MYRYNMFSFEIGFSRLSEAKSQPSEDVGQTDGQRADLKVVTCPSGISPAK